MKHLLFIIKLSIAYKGLYIDKSDEITTRLIAGETEEELTRAGYDQEWVNREQNKIRLIKELTQTADIQAQNNLNIKNL